VAGPPIFDLSVPLSEVTKARNAAQREPLQEELYQALEEEAPEQQRKTVQQAADEFLKEQHQTVVEINSPVLSVVLK
jgi:hypothetical protein